MIGRRSVGIMIIIVLYKDTECQIQPHGCCDGRMSSTSDYQPQDRGFKCLSQLAHQKLSRAVYGWRQWCTVHLAVNESMAIDRWQLYFDYPWRLEACKRVYIPQGVEQVMEVTGLPGVIHL